jgi:hypothetical protein
MPVPAPDHLNNHHRDTLRKIYEQPTSHNIEWPEVLSLLQAVGSAERQHDGKYNVTVGAGTEVLTPPKHKDIGVQQVVDLRRMLAASGPDRVQGF